MKWQFLAVSFGLLLSPALPLKGERPTPPAGICVPGELLFAGPSVFEPGEKVSYHLWSTKPEEPYYFSETGTSGKRNCEGIWRLEGEDGCVLRKGKWDGERSGWRALDVASQELRAGRYRLVAELSYSGTPFSRVRRDIVVRRKGAELVSIDRVYNHTLLKLSGKEGKVALYGTFKTPVPELRLVSDKGISERVAKFEDDRFSEKELFLGYFSSGSEVKIEDAPEGTYRAEMVTGEVRAKPETRGEMRLVMNNDGVSEGFFDPNWSVDRLPEQVERYRNTDVSQLDWAPLVSGVVSYRSDHADFYGEHVTASLPNELENRAMMRAFGALESEEKLYPYLVRLGKEVGVSIWGSLRMSAYYGEHPFGTVMNGRLWREHPEMRIKGPKGERVHFGDNMSFAYPEVQQQRIGVLVEMAEAGCDGVNMDFCRYPGVLGYDAPMLERYRRKYGKDGRGVALDDPNWVAIRQAVLNDFIRKVREALDEVGKKRGRSVKLSVRLPANRFETFGYDPQTWVKEGLVDCLIPAFPGRDRWFDIAEWNRLRQGTGVELLVGTENSLHKVSQNELTDAEKARGIKPGYEFRMKRDDYLRRAAEVYEEGADGMYLFNVWTRVDLIEGISDRRFVESWRMYSDPANLGGVAVLK